MSVQTTVNTNVRMWLSGRPQTVAEVTGQLTRPEPNDELVGDHRKVFGGSLDSLAKKLRSNASSSGCSSLTPTSSDHEIDVDAISDGSGADRSPRPAHKQDRRSSFSVSQLLRKDPMTPPPPVCRRFTMASCGGEAGSAARHPPTPPYQQLSLAAPPPPPPLLSQLTFGGFDPVRFPAVNPFAYGYWPTPFGLPTSATSAFTPVVQPILPQQPLVLDQQPQPTPTLPPSSGSKVINDGGQVRTTAVADWPMEEAGSSPTPPSQPTSQQPMEVQLQRFEPLRLSMPADTVQRPVQTSIRASPMMDGSTMSSLDGSHTSPVSSSTSRSGSPNSAGQPSQSLIAHGKCKICDDSSSGYHYGVVSCEGCKGFFRRSVQKKEKYTCHKDNRCQMTRTSRNRCQACRFRKCLEMGMNRESVRPDRNRKKKAKNDDEAKQVEDTAKLQQIIRTVVSAHNDSMPPMPLEANVNLVDFIRQQMDDERMLRIRHFAQCVPGFSELSVDDQNILWKSGQIAILALRIAIMICGQDRSAFAFHESDLIDVDLSTARLIHQVIRFRDSMQLLQVQTEEIALLCAVCLMWPSRFGLQDVPKVEELQVQLSDALGVQIQLRSSTIPNLFAKLLMKVSDIHALTLGHQKC